MSPALRRLAFMDARAKRGHYWGVLIALNFVNVVVWFALTISALESGTSSPILLLIAPVISLYFWFVVCTARLRDMGRSGWWSLLTLVPFLGWGVALWLGFAASEPDSQT